MDAKKTWKEPVLEVLDVNMTMGGPNGIIPDKNGKGSHNGNHDVLDS